MKIETYYKLLVFHVVLAIGIFLFRPLAMVYFLFIISFFSYKIVMTPKKNKTFYVLFACAYIVGSEVFLRMNGGTFFYEAIKYLVILFCLMGIFSNSFSNNSIIYLFYILLLVPGVFVAVTEMSFETNIRKAIAFNLSGPICLGVAAIFSYKRNIDFKEMQYILLAFLLPLISMTVYLILVTPNLQLAIKGTGSNFMTSGGFGPNQVATVLGIGMFVMAVRFFISKESFFIRLIDLVLFGVLSYRALITFSRGGVITAIVMILFFIGLYYLKVNIKTRSKIKYTLLFFLVSIFFIWMFSAMQTGGFIEKRYANEDALGREKQDLTTGRSSLVAFEFNEFLNSPFLGIGVGKVKEERFVETGIVAASHNEVTRILAEHGVLGIFAFLILLLTPLVYRIRNKKNIFFYSFYLFWLLTINHSAMRIAAPAFVYGLCLLNISYEKPTIHRKPIIAKR